MLSWTHNEKLPLYEHAIQDRNCAHCAMMQFRRHIALPCWVIYFVELSRILPSDDDAAAADDDNNQITYACMCSACGDQVTGRQHRRCIIPQAVNTV